jgi:hypothetical protein
MEFDDYKNIIDSSSEYLVRQTQLETAYFNIFTHANPEDLKLVLDDLKYYVKADQSIFSDNPLIMARRAGRQEIYFYLLNLINKRQL